MSIIAVKLRGGEVITAEDDVALFATFDDLASDPDDGIVMGIGERAAEVSTWPDASTVNTRITTDDPAADAVRECLSGD